MDIWVKSDDGKFFGVVKSFYASLGTLLCDDCVIKNENNIVLMSDSSLQKCKEIIEDIEQVIKEGLRKQLPYIFIDMGEMKKG